MSTSSKHVKPERVEQQQGRIRETVVAFMRSAPGQMRGSACRSDRDTSPRPRVAKHRLFVWLAAAILCQIINSSSLPATTTTSSASCTRSPMSCGRGARALSCERPRAASATPPPPPSRPSPSPGRRARSRRATRGSRPSPQAARELVEQARRVAEPGGGERGGAEAAHADQPVQPAADLAGPGPPRAGRGGAGRLRLAARPGRRGDPGAAAGAEPGAEQDLTGGQT